MNIVEEKLHQFDVVTAHIYNMEHDKEETNLPAFMDIQGFERAKQTALYFNHIGSLGELYRRILTNAV